MTERTTLCGVASAADKIARAFRRHLVDLGAEVATTDNLLVGVQGAQAREVGGAGGFGDRKVGVSGGGVKTFGVNEDGPIGHDDHLSPPLLSWRSGNRRPDAVTHAM